jgi:outer membrane protein insertion porin family
MTRIRRVATYFVMTLAGVATLWGSRAAAQGTPAVVSDVAVVGNVNISREAILGVVSVKQGTPFTIEAVTRDVAAISDLGYFDKVTHHEEDDNGKGVRVIFEVSEHPKIKSIKVTGNTKIPTEKILAALTQGPGDVVNVPRFNKDLDKIQQMYKDAGFAAYVDVNESNFITDGVLNLPIVEVKIERIEVQKTKKTKPYVLLRELRTQPGSVYDGTKLLADLHRIYNLGLLEDIQYRTEPGSSQDKVIIVLEPTEKKTGQVELGFGYSSQQGLIGRAGLSESNLHGTGTSVGVSAEVGGRYRSAGIPPLSLEANYFKPYIDSHRTSMSLSLYNKTTYRFSSSLVSTSTTTDTAYEVRKGGSLAFARPISDYTRIQLSLRDDDIKTYSPTDLTSGTYIVDTQRGSNVVSAGLSLVTDTRDDQLGDPASGYYFTLGSEVGHTRLGGDASVFGTNETSSGVFVKPALDYRRYIALAKRKALNVPTKVLAFRVKAGNIQGPVTFFDQYFVGGADTLRGYTEDRFWGKNQLLGNVELRIPFANSIQGVLFSDFGDAWGSGLRGNPKRYADYLNWAQHSGDSNGDGIQDPAPPPYTIYDAYEYQNPQHSSFDLHTGVGFGIRVKTPIGPLRLDYGISKEGKRTHFSISQTF